MDHLSGTRIRREGTPAAVNLRRCKLVVIKGPQRGTEFVISADVIQVGKAPENDLVIGDETVSRVHFAIVRDAKGYLLRDKNRKTVDGLPFRSDRTGGLLDGCATRERYVLYLACRAERGMISLAQVQTGGGAKTTLLFQPSSFMPASLE